MKRLFCVLWAVIGLLGFVRLSEAVVDRIVAVVNQEIIMLSEVEKAVEASGDEIQAEDRLEKIGTGQAGPSEGLGSARGGEADRPGNKEAGNQGVEQRRWRPPWKTSSGETI